MERDSERAAAGGLDLNQLLPGFEPLSVLWEGDKPVFPSEMAVRWQLRVNREALIKAEAVALLGNKMLVHRERLLKVIRDKALAAYAQRHSEAAGA